MTPARRSPAPDTLREAAPPVIIDMTMIWNSRAPRESWNRPKPRALSCDLRATVRRCGAPAIGVNDNFGRRFEDRRQIVERACRRGARGASISWRLAWSSLMRPSPIEEKRYGQAYGNRIE